MSLKLIFVLINIATAQAVARGLDVSGPHLRRSKRRAVHLLESAPHTGQTDLFLVCRGTVNEGEKLSASIRHRQVRLRPPTVNADYDFRHL